MQSIRRLFLDLIISFRVAYLKIYIYIYYILIGFDCSDNEMELRFQTLIKQIHIDIKF